MNILLTHSSLYDGKTSPEPRQKIEQNLTTSLKYLSAFPVSAAIGYETSHPVT